VPDANDYSALRFDDFASLAVVVEPPSTAGGSVVNGTPDDAHRLRMLAGRGRLGDLTAAERRSLYGAAFETVYPIVFRVVTQRLEYGRGHRRCAQSVRHLGDTCLDGFYDDVDSMVERLLTATASINDLEAWVARSAANAAVDGYRCRRAERGALQRPRMTKVIEAGLPDPWLRELALKILVWVGLPTGAGAAVWPLQAWAQDRAVRTGDLRDSTPARVAADVHQVLAVLGRQTAWFAEHVQRPLGLKTNPTGGAPGDGPHDPRPLVVAEPDEIDRTRVADLASLAVEAVRLGLRRGTDARTVVAEVLGKVFVDGTGAEDIDRVPTGDPGVGERVSALLADPVALSVLVERVLRIVGEGTE
jgi:hypothetical protein